jgi:hypothetical protein
VKPILIALGCMFLTIVGIVVAYGVGWGVWYRMPRGADEVVDLRRSRHVIFCAALANNTHGFPGHAYVAWTADQNCDLKRADSIGFVPRYADVIVPSLYKSVPGLLMPGAHDNYRNLDKLTVIVDPATFERSRKLCNNWNQSNFQTGVRDCCAFTKLIAKDIGLKTPDKSYIYPQDYISELKLLNRQLKITPVSI